MDPLLSLDKIGAQGLSRELSLDILPGVSCLFLTSGESESRALMLMMTGQSLPEQGRLGILGHDTAGINHEDLMQLRLSLGVVTGSGGLISNLKLWENITLPLRYHRLENAEEAEKESLDILARFGLEDRLMELPGHLSTFERRVVSFARAAAVSPKIMIYCGCFDNLPARQRELFLESAVGLHQRKSGIASIFITSSTTALENLKPDMSCNLRHKAAETEKTE